MVVKKNESYKRDNDSYLYRLKQWRYVIIFVVKHGYLFSDLKFQRKERF